MVIIREALQDRGLLRELDQPIDVCAFLTPNWFASVMGTGIVANAAALLPLQFPGLRVFGTIVWAIASAVLIALLVGTFIHWTRYRKNALKHHLNPVMAQFYGAPPMAMMTVGLGTLLLGQDVIGMQAALVIDWVLWLAGTALGLFVAVAIPYLTMTRHSISGDAAFGGWLMPLVSPMVSATTGAALIPHVPEGQLRLTMLLACYAMFGMSLIGSCIIITLLWSRLMYFGIGDSQMIPTMWIVLGPLGQSITAANVLAGVANLALPDPYSNAFMVMGLVYGIAAWGFTALWFTLVTAITFSKWRKGRKFALTWWSFIFPVGTCVTGTIDLSDRAESSVLDFIATTLYFGLVIAWALVARRTVIGAWTGRLFLPPPAPAAQPAL